MPSRQVLHPSCGTPCDHPVPSREAIFGRRAVEASDFHGRRYGGYRRHSPYPSVSSFSLHLLLGGAVCAVPRAAPDYSRSARYACLLCAQVWLKGGGATGGADGCLCLQKQGEMLPGLRGGVRGVCASKPHFSCSRHSLPLDTHARRPPSQTRASCQSESTARGGRQGLAGREGKLGGE